MKECVVVNEMGKNDQVSLFPTQVAFPVGYLCFSRFRAAANYVMDQYEVFVGRGDKQNIIEDALATAYKKGWEDSQK